MVTLINANDGDLCTKDNGGDEETSFLCQGLLVAESTLKTEIQLKKH
jgi:hypothetical protein